MHCHKREGSAGRATEQKGEKGQNSGSVSNFDATYKAGTGDGDYVQGGKRDFSERIYRDSRR